MASEHHNLNSTLTARTEFYGPWDNVHIKSVLRGREGVRQILTKGRLHVFGTDNWKGGGSKIPKIYVPNMYRDSLQGGPSPHGPGWADSDLRSSQAGGPLLQLSTAQEG